MNGRKMTIFIPPPTAEGHCSINCPLLYIDPMGWHNCNYLVQDRRDGKNIKPYHLCPWYEEAK